MASEVFQLAVLLTLKDSASSGLDRFGTRLRAAGRDGDKFHSQFEKIRNDLNRDLGVGAVGVAGLALLKKGVDVAADYESQMLDLRSAYQETGAAGSRSADQQKKDIKELSVLATRLGSDLAGSTGDYVEILTAMKKAGIEVETVLGGAGEAAAHLANINKTIGTGLAPEGAKELGQYGKMFDLKQNEYKSTVNLFSALKDRFDVSSSELVEGSKYFASTAKTAMDLRGYEGANSVAKLIAFSKRYTGYEGSRSGTNLDAIVTQFVQHPEAVKALEQKSGIKLDFFDSKGKFKGDTADQRVETLFREMEKLRALDPKSRLESLNSIFGVEGGRIAGQMVEQGVAGWKSITDEANKAVPVNEKIIAQMATYNAKTEALSGSWTNFKATAFTPLMEDAKKLVDLGSKGVNWLQQFAAEHPNVAKVATEFAAVGSAVLVVYSGVKLLTAGIRIMRLASAFSKSEGLLGYMTQAGTATSVVTRNVTGLTAKQSALQQLGGTIVATDSKAKNLSSTVVGTSNKVGGLRKNLLSLDNVFKAVLVFEAIGFTWDQIANLQQVMANAKETKGGLKDVGKSSYDLYNKTPENARNPKAEAKSMGELLQHGRGKQFEKSLDPSRKTWTDTAADLGKFFGGKDTRGDLYGDRLPKGHPLMTGWQERVDQYKKQRLPSMFRSAGDRVNKETAGAHYIRERAPSLADPKVMSSFRKDVMPTMNLSAEMTDHVDKMLKLAFPESFSQSLTGMFEKGSTAFAESLMTLKQPVSDVCTTLVTLPPAMTPVALAFTDIKAPIDQTNASLVDIYNSGNRLPGSFNNIVNSGNNFAVSIDGLTAKIANWQPPASPTAIAPPTGGQPTPIFGVPSRAIGGVVERSGMAMVHAGNAITPAGVTRGLWGFNELMTLARNANRRPIDKINFPSRGDAANAFAQYNLRPVDRQPEIFNLPFASQPLSTSFQKPAGNSADLSGDLRSNRVGAPTRDGISNFRFDLPRSRPIDPELLEARRPLGRGERQTGSSSGPISFNYAPKITVNGADEKAAKQFADELEENARYIKRMFAEFLAQARERA